MNINATLLVQMVTFLVFVWFTMKFVWPPIIKALEKRRALIEEGLAQADKSREALEIAQKEGAQLLAKTREQAASIIRSAEERAQKIIDDAVAQSVKRAQDVLTHAHNEIDNQYKKAKQELYNEIAGLALRAAGQVVHNVLENDTSQQQFVAKQLQTWNA